MWKDKAVLACTSAVGLGYMPVAPGTWGALAALPLWYAARHWSPMAQAVAVLALTVIAVLTSQRAEEIYGGHDSSKIVIDEVVGLLTAAVGLQFDLPHVVAVFVAFRFFDIAKPWPVGAIDRRVNGGLGVVLDDTAAGLLAALVVRTGFYLFG